MRRSAAEAVLCSNKGLQQRLCSNKGLQQRLCSNNDLQQRLGEALSKEHIPISLDLFNLWATTSSASRCTGFV